jgi:hypothetical protein
MMSVVRHGEIWRGRKIGHGRGRMGGKEEDTGRGEKGSIVME